MGEMMCACCACTSGHVHVHALYVCGDMLYSVISVVYDVI